MTAADGRHRADPSRIPDAAQNAAVELHDAGASNDDRRRNLFKRFEDWCADHGFASFPADDQTVRFYVCALAAAGLAPGSIRNAEAAIRAVHAGADYVNPGLHGPNQEALAVVLRGITKDYTEPRKQAPPLTVEDLLRLLSHDHRSRIVRRDQCTLVLARHLDVPIATAVRAKITRVAGEGIVVRYPTTGGGRRRYGGWVEVLVAPGDGSLLDPHHQLLSLCETLTAADSETPIGLLSRKPGSPPLQKSMLSRNLGRVLNRQSHTDLEALNDAEMLEVLYACDRGWLMRLQMDALVVLLFAGALRGIEGRSMRVRHWRYRVFASGVTLFLPFSKSSLDGQGEEVEIPHDLGGVLRPVDLVDRWIATAGLAADDLIFTGLQGVGTRPELIDRSAEPITAQTLIHRLAKISGDLELEDRLTGHSARRGFATAAADAGIELEAIAQHLRQKRISTVQLYIERHSPGVHGRAVADGVVRSLEGHV